MMQLIGAPASPFVRKVRLLIRETNQLDDVEEVTISTSPLHVDAKAQAGNPVGRIPSLIRPDGPALYDSRVITRYLDDRVKAGLYPDRDLWDVLTLEATGEEIMTSTVALSYETRLRPEEKQWDDWIDSQWSKVIGGIDALQSRWMAHLNAPLNMGHIAVASALSYIDFRHDHRNWRQGHDALADWYADFSKRQSMIDTDPA